MATSGSYIFNMTAYDIILAAFKKIGVTANESALGGVELQDGITALNLMIKTWQAFNPHLWTTTQGVLFLNYGQARYALGPTGDNAAFVDDFIAVSLTADADAGETLLSVQATVGMLVGDYVGIQISNDVRQWTTITAINSLTQITVADGLVDAAASGNSVFTYTNKIVRPLRVLDSRRKTFNQPDEISLTEFSQEQYFAQVNKDEVGVPISWYYSPQLNNGLIYLWQPSSTVNQLLYFTLCTPLQDVGAQNNTLAFPAEWLEGIVFNVAMRLTDDYSTPEAKVITITQKAMAFFEQVVQYDEEMTSLNIMPDYTR